MLWDSIEGGNVVDCLKSLALGALVDDTIEIEAKNEDLENNETLIQSAVQRAAQLKQWTSVSLLLLWGAEIDHVDTLGRNLVHYLAGMSDSSISVLLTISRKNVGLGGWEDRAGRTPLQYAEESTNAPVATIIRIFQAQMDEATAASNRGPLSASAVVQPLPASGQESPLLFPESSQTPFNTMTAAFEKVLNHYGGKPFKFKE